MKTRILWKGALIGSLALPLAAFAQSDTGSDPNANQPSQTDTTNPGANDQQGQMNQGAQGQMNQNPGAAGQMNQGAMNDATGTKQVTGTISKVSKHQVWLNAEDGTTLTLHTDKSTMVYKPTGTTESVSQLKEGQQIRASYDMKSSKPHAVRIDVMEAGATGTPGTQQGTQGTGGTNQ